MSTDRIFDVAKEAMLVLNRSGIDYALCGGLAVAVHGFFRATEDVDVLVRNKDDARRIQELLAAQGWITSPAGVTFPDGFIMHRAVKAVGRHAIPLDILVQPEGQDFLTDRLRAEIDSCACWVIAKDRLVVMKRSAGRPKDLIDIAALNGEGS